MTYSVKLSVNDLPPLSATTLLVTVLGLSRRLRLPAKQLIEVGDMFGHSERSIRVSLARLTADGRICSPQRGIYAAGGDTRAVIAELEAWKRIEERLVPWDGSWLVMHTAKVSRVERKRLRHHERALRLRGFRAFDDSLWCRPGNLGGGLASLKRAMRDLGLDEQALLLRVRELDPAMTNAVRGLWDVAELRSSYRSSLDLLRRSTRSVQRQDRQQNGMVETLRVGHYVVRQILLDPLLPEEMIGSEDRSKLIADMATYDDLGKSLWAAFLSA